jgi:mannose-6-phosphate isomerase-like protein (cupin superfamily)
MARDERNPPPLDWSKGHAVSSRSFYEIGMHPAIIELVATLLGKDFMLWGASIQTRRPGALHPWHCDIETADSSGKTVSVWIGLEHANRDSSLVIIPYSHRFGVTVQEVRHRKGKGRDETTNDEVTRWARELDQRSYLARLGITDGEALFFDGRLWHSSHNLFHKTRRALLLQYATPDAVIRIPDINNLDWPFKRLNSPRPACLMVEGNAKVGDNRIVPGPVATGGKSVPQLTSRVYPLRLPLPPEENKHWTLYPLFDGSTTGTRHLSCHVSVLTQNQSPHPPHKHQEEEILLLLSGEVDLLLPDLPTTNGETRKRLRPGEMVYYPAHFAHTLQTVSEEPATYLMLKWRNGSNSIKLALQLGCRDFNCFYGIENSEVEPGFHPRLLFEGPTGFMRKLHCHVSTLTSGAGYEPHIDAYDVAMVVLKGEVETLGERVNSNGVIFYAAGEPHGIHNPGKTTAKYVVFEFHGRRHAFAHAAPNLLRELVAKLKDPRYWKRKLRHFTKHLTRSEPK